MQIHPDVSGPVFMTKTTHLAWGPCVTPQGPQSAGIPNSEQERGTSPE